MSMIMYLHRFIKNSLEHGRTINSNAKFIHLYQPSQLRLTECILHGSAHHFGCKVCVFSTNTSTKVCPVSATSCDSFLLAVHKFAKSSPSQIILSPALHSIHPVASAIWSTFEFPVRSHGDKYQWFQGELGSTREGRKLPHPIDAWSFGWKHLPKIPNIQISKSGMFLAKSCKFSIFHRWHLDKNDENDEIIPRNRGALWGSIAARVESGLADGPCWSAELSFCGFAWEKTREP